MLKIEIAKQFEVSGSNSKENMQFLPLKKAETVCLEMLARLKPQMNSAYRGRARSIMTEEKSICR